MTKQEILNKIEELKKKKSEAEKAAKLQDVFQHSFKICLNTVYGFTGTKFSPVFNRDIAESVTLTGQSVIKEMVQFTNKCLNKIGNNEGDWVIAGDTDSMIGSSKINIDDNEIEIEKAFDIVEKSGHIDVLENGTEVAVASIPMKTESLNGKTYVKNISRHKVDKQMYSVKIPGHEELVITEDNSIMVQRDGKIIECKPDEIGETDFLIVED